VSRALSLGPATARVQLAHELVVLEERLQSLFRCEAASRLDDGVTRGVGKPGDMGPERARSACGDECAGFLGNLAGLKRHRETCTDCDPEQQLERDARHAAIHDLAERRLGNAEAPGRGELIDGGSIGWRISNAGTQRATVSVLDAYNGQVVTRQLLPGQSFEAMWSRQDYFGWYDLTVTVAEDPRFDYRLAGHIETGRDSSSDPALGA
jgi:hypothetical protein